jgi:hypothetical protein
MGMNCCKSRCWKMGLLMLAGIAALGWVVMALWNWLMPALFFGTREIGYLQALGVLVLSKILFGSLRGRGCHGRWHRQRLEQMTPEQREKFQAGMRGCCVKRKDDDADAIKQQHD